MNRRGVSAVIPVYNGAPHLAEAIHSALTQSVPPPAVIVVDDGSEDATQQVAARFGNAIRYVRQVHGGAASARNAGALLVESEYLAFLDADDLWSNNKLERQLAALHDADHKSMALGHAVQFASSELSWSEVERLKFNPAPMPGIAPSALLMRTDAFRATDGFNPDFHMGEFVEWYGRAQAAGYSTLMLPDVVFRRRLHRGNHGRVRADLRADYARAMKAVLDRRRRNA